MLFNNLLLIMIGSGIIGTILLICNNKIINFLSIIPILIMAILYSSLTYSATKIKIVPQNTNKYSVIEQKDISTISKDNEYYILTDDNNTDWKINKKDLIIINNTTKNKCLEKRAYEYKYIPKNLIEKIKLSEMKYYGVIDKNIVVKERYVLIK